MRDRYEAQPPICTDYEERLNAYVDGELAFEEQPELFAHLAFCSRCRRFLDGVLSLRRTASDEPLAVPPLVDEAFLQRLADHREAVVSARRRAGRRERVRQAAPKAGRLVLVSLLAGIGLTALLQGSAGDVEAPGDVVGEEELVNFRPPPQRNTDSGAIYVFYPGLTIEAENWAEGASSESL